MWLLGVGRHQLPQVESKPLRFNCELDAARCCKSVFRTPVIVTCKDSGAHERLYRSAMKTSGGSGEEWPSDSHSFRTDALSKAVCADLSAVVPVSD